MKEFKKIFTFLLAFVLVFSSCAPAFADQENTIKYVALGDSSSIGYGLQDFEFYMDGKAGYYSGKYSRIKAAYIHQFPDYLAEKTGCEVSYENLALCGMRTNELAEMIKTDFNYDELDAYGRVHWGWYDGSYEIPQATEAYADYNELHDTYCNAIEKADVISYDLGTNNFGNYLMARIAESFGISLGYPWGFSDDHFNELMADNNIDISIETKNTVTALAASILNGAVTEEQLAAVTDALLYAYANFCIGFRESINRIYELNDDVKLIVLGLYNPIEGIVAKYGRVTVDIGALFGGIIDIANEYIISFNEHRGDYSYADLSGGVENVAQSLARGVEYDYLREGLIKLFYSGNMFGETYAVRLMEKLAYGEAPASVPATLNNALEALRQPENTYYEPLRTGIDSALDSFVKAAHYSEPMDLESGLSALENGLSGLGSIFEPCFIDFDSASGLSKSALHLVLYLLENGTGAHPSEYGQQQKLQALIKGYESPAAANGTHLVQTAETLGTVFSRLFGRPDWFNALIDMIKEYIRSAFSIIRIDC